MYFFAESFMKSKVFIVNCECPLTHYLLSITKSKVTPLEMKFFVRKNTYFSKDR